MESAFGGPRVPATSEPLSDERRVPTIGTGRSGVPGEAFARFDFKRHVAGASIRVTAPFEAEGAWPHHIQCRIWTPPWLQHHSYRRTAELVPFNTASTKCNEFRYLRVRARTLGMK